ncbi:hypothetical protein GCM10022237_50630 [Nocardioides ginsengisoli]|uniref:Uncharacterized protein n=1 Tax=Nocardioides ginsengisoli TaxID=363868 RepID=A0ABW3VWR6_9ACTN
MAGVLGGVLWQLADRRDLVDRITFPAVLLAVSIAMSLIPGAYLEMSGNGPVFWMSILVALVLTEQNLRWREDRRRRAALNDRSRPVPHP